MSNADKLYIRSVKNKGPNNEIFVKMVEILKKSQEEVERLSSFAHNLNEI